MRKKILFIILVFFIILWIPQNTTALAFCKNNSEISWNKPKDNNTEGDNSFGEQIKQWIQTMEKKEGGVSGQGNNVVANTYEATEPTGKWASLADAITEFESVIKIITNFMFGYAVLNGVLCAIITVLRFAGSGTHPMQRRQAIVDMGLCAITTALLGSVKIVSVLILHMVM